MLECVDFDECEKFNFCADSLHCTNTIGSYICGCRPGYKLSRKENSCSDIDECSIRNSCPTKATCQNTEGNFTCSCLDGYEGHLCTDIDECASDQNCDINADCINTEGSFECACKEGYYGNGAYCARGKCNDASCPTNQACISETTIDCKCVEGFEFDQSNDCVDIDECSTSNNCDINSKCENLPFTYTCACNIGFIGNGTSCSCPKGFFLTPNRVCADLNECSTSHECHTKAKCTNSIGTYDCKCETGFIGNGRNCNCQKGFEINHAGNCIDVDECSTEGTCHPNADCENTIGSYECRCKYGFVGNGKTCEATCKVSNSCHVYADCIKSVGSYTCQCKTGFDGNGTSCDCTSGFSIRTLGENKECVDINECEESDYCMPNSLCHNTIGSFECNCTLGYNKNGTRCVAKSILVLNSGFFGWKTAIIDSMGGQKEVSCVTKGETTEAYQSCSVIWQNKMHVFGVEVLTKAIINLKKIHFEPFL